MRTGRFPREFEGLLSPRGLRVLRGEDASWRGALADPRTRRFVYRTGLVDLEVAARCRALLDAHLRPCLSLIDTPIPSHLIAIQERNAQEWLPKVARQKTARLERKGTAAYRAAEAVGLVECLASDSFRRFAEVVAGRPLRPRQGMQLLCYEPGDYAGPHNDHFPEEPAAEGGYVDVHVTLSSPAVAHQHLVLAQDGHFSASAPVHRDGTVTAYRLPFWHLATPLVARRGREAEARRWVLLGTFLYADAGVRRRR